MASQLLRAPEKGARQQSLVDEQALELRTQMAAHYLQTDHDTDGGRLIQGQVDHTLLVGHRVRTSTEELEKLRAGPPRQERIPLSPLAQRAPHLTEAAEQMSARLSRRLLDGELAGVEQAEGDAPRTPPGRPSAVCARERVQR